MTSFAIAVLGAQPTSEELVQELRAGRQRHVVVVHGNDVVFGWAVVLAAKAVGLTTIAVVECDGGDGRHSSELLLIAAKLRLEAALGRLTPDEFTARMMRAALDDAWVRNSTRRPPRPTSPAKAQARKKRRDELISEAFGVAPRTLERDGVLARLAPELRNFVRSEDLPMGAVEDVGRLPSYRQRELANRLKKGGTFAKLRTEFLGDGGAQRKTDRGAAGAIRSSIHTLVLEARGREDCFALRPDEYALARASPRLIHGWLAVTPRTHSTDEHVGHLASELRHGRNRSTGATTVTDGDHGAAEGR